ncbi:MAG: inositol monophosphatase [Elusimicrobia bacterium]|nr:inositol monophosphatase [Elusimicrobiota bacterium]
MTDREEKRLRRTLVRALRAGGGLLRAGLGRTSYTFKDEGHANVVTPVDLASEQAVLDEIAGSFPRHDFLTEEREARRTGSDWLWVIDPLDGTLNYAHGVPVSCVSIALLREGKPFLGGVYDPFREELFLARSGGGATLNGRRLAVSRVPSLSRALVVVGFPYDRNRRASLYGGLTRDCLRLVQDLRRSGSAALDLSWVAAGRYDGYWEFNLKPWDVAAGRLLIQEAGGKVTDFSGKPWGPVDVYGRQTLGSNGRVHRELLRLLERVKDR